MFKRLLGVCVALAMLLTVMPSEQVSAQTVVTIANGTQYSYSFPYSTYYYTKWYTALLYNSTRIASKNGGTAPIGLISKLELQGADAYYNGFSDVGQTVRLYLAQAPNQQFAAQQHSSFSNFLAGGAPGNLQNVQLVYTGKFMTSPLTQGQWAGVDLDNKYLYTGGNLVLIIRTDVATSQQSFPGGYGSWFAEYLYSGPPLGTQYTSLYWYGYDFGDYTEQTGYEYGYLPNLRISVLSGIESSFPDDVDPRRILRAGEIYDGRDASHPRPSLTFRSTPGATNLTYKIVSLATGQPIYIATDNNNPNDTIINLTYSSSGLTTYNFTSAKGSAAGTNGALDLTNTPGGAFRVVANYTTPASSYSQDWVKEFSISYANDLAIRQIVAPNPSTDARAFKYPRGVPIPFQAKFQNVGLNNVTTFRAVAEVRNTNNVVVYTDTVNYTGNLATGDIATIDFANFATLNVGSYNVRICGTLIGAFDQQSGNDCLPSGGNYTFAVQYGVEAEATTILVPTNTGTYYAGRPFAPRAVFTNRGIEDLSDVPATMTIRNTRTNIIVYTSSIIVTDIARNSSANATFANFTAPTTDIYEACVTINHPDDAVAANNTICSTFNVLDQLSGTYTIGTQNNGSIRNFTTMQDAVDALYSRGVSGPVIFELTDATYVVGNAAFNAPALDMRAQMLGVNATNTVTFRAASNRSTSKASVTVQLRTGSGLGIYLGEAYVPSNRNAIIIGGGLNTVKNNEYANATGYITFDGGAQKSLRFTLESNAAQRAVFYLGSESNNTTIKNVIIENSPSSTASYQSSLPQTRFSQGNLTFSYEGDVRNQTNGQINTYSAGVVIRNTPTTATDLQSATLGVADTNTSDNNRVTGNEITGFGFGVVGIGIGPLYRPTLQGRFLRYYMKGLEIRDNIIQNVSRAGIYVANTEGADISGNRIANVGVTATGVAPTEGASGILTGGESSYNNMNMRIARNEISGVTSPSFVRGIAVEQVEQEFLNGSGTVYRFPDEAGRNKATSNMVWGLSRTAGTGNAAGIHFFTQRSATQTGINQLLTAQRSRFFATQDTIAGNTVIMNSDGQTGAGIVAGIGVQQARVAVVYNNAIAVLGGSATATTANTALLFEGLLNQKIRTGTQAGQMTNDAIMSNRNAFWTPNATIARFIQVDDQSRTVNIGSYDEYTTLSQWRQGTGQDINSVYGDWTTDYEYTGTAPLQRLRVKITPNTPIGSILNNRGERLANLGNDIDNEVRGAAGQRPDIGGDEFNGRLYVNDIESVEILRPGSYRSQTGNFRDAEYIMTEAPANVTVRIRNGGSIAQANTSITLRIYAETAGSSQTNPIPVPAQYGGAVLTKTVLANLPAGESVDVDFTNLSFSPQTYAELGMAATAPTQFRTMARNVTPRYRIEVETVSDENNSNNVTSKDVRFYLVKSGIRMMASVRGSTVDLSVGTPTANDIAGRLNSDTLRMALRGLGWDNNGVDVGVYDLFDRNNWEPRAVDYTPYRTLLWAQDTTRMTLTARNDLRNYVYAGSIGNKKNLAIASQEIARKHIGFDPVNDEDFVRTILRTQYIAPGTPFTPNYDGKRVIGVAVAEATSDLVRTTAFAGDMAPVPALVRVFSDATTEGLARAAYKYETRTAGVLDSIMGVAATTTYANVVYLGVDWRHFARTTNSSRSGAERVLRGVMDFFEKNGGTVVPVELAGPFQAEALKHDNQWTVNLWWKVASEVNVANYEVERAEATAKGLSEFKAVASNTPGKVNYQTTDRSVEAGHNYIYRLRSTDRDGSFKLSNEVEVSINDDNAQTFTMSPMPVVNTAKLEYAATEGTVQFIVFDAQGREVMTITGANGKADFNASNLSSGAYTVQMMVNGATNGTISISVVK